MKATQMNRTPILSIGMPVFNAEKYLRRALDSLLAQTFDNCELIISDNASEDDTENICREYASKHQNIYYSRNSENVGVSRNFNKVFYASKGVYFMWAAHDDMWEPDYIEKCVQALEDNTEAVLCYSATKFIDADGNFLKIWTDKFSLEQEDPVDRYLTILSQLNWCNCFYGVIRSKALQNTELLQRNVAASDNLLLAHLSLKGKFIQLDDPLFYRNFPTYNNVENFDERFARLYKIDSLTNMGITLPFCQWIKHHCNMIIQTSFDITIKDQLISKTIHILLNRYRQQINTELSRAISLINNGAIHTQWGHQSEPAALYKNQPCLNFFSILELSILLELAYGFTPNFPGLHHARGILAHLMGRPEEALVSIKLELNRDPQYQPSLDFVKRHDKFAA